MGHVLVTGGFGFLGSHLVDRLLSMDQEVVIVDNCSSPVVDIERYRATCDIFVGDVASYQAPRGRVFDLIFHLADIAGPYRIISYAGTIGPRSMVGLEAALRAATPGQTKFVFVSSSEIYGRAGSYPEETAAMIYTPYTIRLEYAVAKSLCEITALNYGQRVGVSVKVVRPFNIAGPRQSSGGGFVLPRFFEAALAGTPLTVFGDGNQVRSFTHVLDTVDSLIQVAEANISGEIFNSGNPRNKTTILDLALLVKEYCNSTSEIAFIDPRAVFGQFYAESFDKVPDVRKIERMLGWRAKRDLGQVLNDTLNEYQARRGGSTPA